MFIFAKKLKNEEICCKIKQKQGESALGKIDNNKKISIVFWLKRHLKQVLDIFWKTLWYFRQSFTFKPTVPLSSLWVFIVLPSIKRVDWTRHNFVLIDSFSFSTQNWHFHFLLNKEEISFLQSNWFIFKWNLQKVFSQFASSHHNWNKSKRQTEPCYCN